MNLSSQKIREIVLQTLFCFEISGEQTEELIPFLVKELMVSRSTAKKAFIMALSIWNIRDNLDSTIAQILKNYTINELPDLEKNILRLCIYQLINPENEIAPKTMVSEGSRLATKFVSSEAASFISAVLLTYNNVSKPPLRAVDTNEPSSI